MRHAGFFESETFENKPCHHFCNKYFLLILLLMQIQHTRNNNI